MGDEETRLGGRPKAPHAGGCGRQDTSVELLDAAASMKGSGWGRRELSLSSD